MLSSRATRGVTHSTSLGPASDEAFDLRVSARALRVGAAAEHGPRDYIKIDEGPCLGAVLSDLSIATTDNDAAVWLYSSSFGRLELCFSYTRLR